MNTLPTPEECMAYARVLAVQIDPEAVDVDGDTLPEEWYMYHEHIEKLITFCQTNNQKQPNQ